MGPSVPDFALCDRCAGLVRFWGDRSGNTFGGAVLWSDGVLEAPMLAPAEMGAWRCPHCNEVVWQPALARSPTYDRASDSDERDDSPGVIVTRLGDEQAAMRILRVASGMGVYSLRERLQALPTRLDVEHVELAERLAEELGAAGTLARATAGRIARRAVPELRPVSIEDAIAYASTPAAAPHERGVRLDAWLRGSDRFRTGDRWQSPAARGADIVANLERLFVLTPGSQPDAAPDDVLLAVEMLRQLERWDEASALAARAVGHRYERRFHWLIAARVSELVRL